MNSEQEEFRSGGAQVMVGCGQVSHGMDFPGLDIVVMYDVPSTQRGTPDESTFLHRTGRVGRPEKGGGGRRRRGAVLHLVGPSGAADDARLRSLMGELGIRLTAELAAIADVGKILDGF